MCALFESAGLGEPTGCQSEFLWVVLKIGNPDIDILMWKSMQKFQTQ